MKKCYRVGVQRVAVIYIYNIKRIQLGYRTTSKSWSVLVTYRTVTVSLLHTIHYLQVGTNENVRRTSPIRLNVACSIGWGGAETETHVFKMAANFRDNSHWSLPFFQCWDP